MPTAYPGQTRKCERERRSASALARALLIFVGLLLLLPDNAAFSQDERDTWGREFWVTFMENQGSDPEVDYSTLRLYMASDSVTTVRVEFFPLEGVYEIALDNPGVPVELDVNNIFGNDTELAAVFDDGSNLVSRRSFRITSDHDITLYGASLRRMSADAFLALPDDILSSSYIVTGWRNGLLDVPSSGFPAEYDRHSEFAVVATEDGTTVRIEPSTQLVGFPWLKDPAEIEVALDRGDVFFAQAVLDAPNDVSGTRIRANKPIAVFAGNQRTAIPSAVGNYRDHLVEQMPPIEAWGEEALLVPHFEVDRRVPYEALGRVQAAFEETELEILQCFERTVPDGLGGFRDTLVEFASTATISPESPFVVDPLVPTRIRSNRPILVSQFEHSVGGSGDRQDARTGDPFMMLIPSPEQFGTSYPFQSIDHQDMLRHFINVVIPEGAEESLRLDGNPVQPVPIWQKMPGGEYLYAQIEVQGGAHRIEADEPFGLAAYGFGLAVSYGYVGGSLFRELPVDYLRPVIEAEPFCYDLTGRVADADVTDSGIDSLYADRGTINVLLTIDPFDAGDEEVAWSATLVDPYQDGRLDLKAIDRAGRSTSRIVDIPGFTLGTSPDGADEGRTVEFATYNGRDSCYSLTLYNYGAFPQETNRISLLDSDGGFAATVIDQLPVTIAPGDSTVITFCVPGGSAELVNMSVEIANNCIERPGPTVNRHNVIDTDGPTVIADVGDCSGGFIISISEEDRQFFGVASITVDTIANATWELQPGNLPSVTADLRLTAIDERQDLYVEATAVDRAGNSVQITELFPGFTLQVNDLDEYLSTERQVAIRLEEDWQIDTLALHIQHCDSVELVNYGATTLSIARVYMTGNTVVSIPPSQLPIAIEPGGRRTVELCFEADRAGDLEDTLVFEDRCGRIEQVRSRTHVRSLPGSGADICGNLLTLSVRGNAKATFIEAPVPNPMIDGAGIVDIGLASEAIVTIELLGLDGRIAATLLLEEPVEAGVHRVAFRPGRIATGAYVLRMQTSFGDVVATRLIVQE